MISNFDPLKSYYTYRWRRMTLYFLVTYYHWFFLFNQSVGLLVTKDFLMLVPWLLLGTASPVSDMTHESSSHFTVQSFWYCYFLISLITMVLFIKIKYCLSFLLLSFKLWFRVGFLKIYLSYSDSLLFYWIKTIKMFMSVWLKRSIVGC